MSKFITPKKFQFVNWLDVFKWRQVWYRKFLSNIEKLEYRETGDLTPKSPGGNPRRKLTDEQVVILAELIENHNDSTLEELCDLLLEKTGVKISRATMGRLTHQLNYSFKKNALRSRKRSRICENKKSAVLVVR